MNTTTDLNVLAQQQERSGKKSGSDTLHQNCIVPTACPTPVSLLYQRVFDSGVAGRQQSRSFFGTHLRFADAALPRGSPSLPGHRRFCRLQDENFTRYLLVRGEQSGNNYCHSGHVLAVLSQRQSVSHVSASSVSSARGAFRLPSPATSAPSTSAPTSKTQHLIEPLLLFAF